MHRSIRKPKKNLFDQDDDNMIGVESQIKQAQKPTSNKMIAKTNQIYDAAKIQENEMYINRNVKEQQLKQQNNIKDQSKNKPKKKLGKNKKNLFDSDSEQDKKEKEEKYQSIKDQIKKSDVSQEQTVHKQSSISTKEQFKNNQTKPNAKSNQNQQSFAKNVNFSDDQIQDNQQQLQEQDKEETKRAEQIKQMIKENPKTNQQKVTQISFSKLLQKEGGDKLAVKNLLYDPIPKGYRAICIFKRVQNGFSQNYQLLMEDGDRAFIFCQNQRGCIGANYYISLTKQMDKNSISYLGKLRGNKTGSIYQLYDGGKQPESNINRRLWRCSLARIQYETNILGMNGPRKLQVIIPDEKQQLDIFKLAQNQDLSILQPPLITKFRNKQPRWNQRLKSYALNFGGKVKQASIKNFILVNDETEPQQQFNATNTLIFGKIDQNNFSLQAIYPLSVYQAFGIVLSQFDFKLNCQ